MSENDPQEFPTYIEALLKGEQDTGLFHELATNSKFRAQFIAELNNLPSAKKAYTREVLFEAMNKLEALTDKQEKTSNRIRSITTNIGITLLAGAAVATVTVIAPIVIPLLIIGSSGIATIAAGEIGANKVSNLSEIEKKLTQTLKHILDETGGQHDH